MYLYMAEQDVTKRLIALCDGNIKALPLDTMSLIHEAEARQVGADFVLTNGEESFVTVTVQMTNKHTGEAISTVSGIKIPYKRGHLTTVSGHFLTAGKTAGGVQVDTEWNDVIIKF